MSKASRPLFGSPTPRARTTVDTTTVTRLDFVSLNRDMTLF
jgi:hypothetical protein